jgi:hypothetical protein
MTARLEGADGMAGATGDQQGRFEDVQRSQVAAAVAGGAWNESGSDNPAPAPAPTPPARIGIGTGPGVADITPVEAGS